MIDVPQKAPLLILNSILRKVQVMREEKKQSYKGYSHEKTTEEEHEDEVSRASSERTLFEHTTVSVPGSQELRESTPKIFIPQRNGMLIYDCASMQSASLLVCIGAILAGGFTTPTLDPPPPSGFPCATENMQNAK